MPDTSIETPVPMPTDRFLRRLRQALSIATALALSGCGYERFLADREIERLCKMDGGVRVIELTIRRRSSCARMELLTFKT
jgi:hypothetical protein